MIVGFGINIFEKFEVIVFVFDGVVVGFVIVKMIGDGKLVDEVLVFVKMFVDGVYCV